jgi:hypothetical protein
MLRDVLQCSSEVANIQWSGRDASLSTSPGRRNTATPVSFLCTTSVQLSGMCFETKVTASTPTADLLISNSVICLATVFCLLR